MHHIKHNGPVPLFLGVWGPAPYFPFQQDMKSIMGLGISHEIPNKENTRDLNSWATTQWRKKRLWFLHIWHQSIIITTLFLRLYVVRIFPNSVPHMKKGAWGALGMNFPYALSRRGKIPLLLLIICSNSSPESLGFDGIHTKLSISSPKIFLAYWIIDHPKTVPWILTTNREAFKKIMDSNKSNNFCIVANLSLWHLCPLLLENVQDNYP